MEITTKIYIIANDLDLMAKAIEERKNSLLGSTFLSCHKIEAGERKEPWYYYVDEIDGYSPYYAARGGSKGNDWQGMLERSGILLGNNGAVIFMRTSPDEDMYEEYQWSSPSGYVESYTISENVRIYNMSLGKFYKKLGETVGEAVVQIYKEASKGRGEQFNISNLLWEKESRQYWQKASTACENGTTLREWIETCRKDISQSDREAYEETVQRIDKEAKIEFDFHLFDCVSYANQSVEKGIEERGGSVYNRLDKMTDYLVVSLAPIKSSMYRLYEEAQARNICVVSDYQVYQALLNTPPLFKYGRPRSGIKPMDRIMTYKKDKIEREKQRKSEEAKRLREEKRRLLAEEKMRLAEEARKRSEEKRSALYEAKQKEAEERQRLKEEEQQKKAEQDRLAREAKARKEQARREAIANAKILCAPGEEPVDIRRYMETLFAKLDEAYPEKKISRLYQDHKKWGERVTKLYRLLGYPDGNAFLEAYGYTVEMSAMGRKASVDPIAIMEELHRRYPDGGAESMTALQADNPDIPWKTLANNAKEYFGNTLAKHLKAEGILK